MPPATSRHEFLRSCRNGALIGAALLAVAIPWMREEATPEPRTAMPSTMAQPDASRPLPAFGDEPASADALHVANWAFFSGDNEGKAVVILDKKAAKVFTFDPSGRLIAATPALLGSAVGDDNAPGIGDKPLAQILPEEKTTAAGRYVAEPGVNASGEDVIWIDYNAALSMHRVRPTVAAERRLERLASPSEDDNRISFGCVNLPVDFYEGVLSPTVRKTGAIVYVLPETLSPQEVFGSFDITDPAALAAWARRPPEADAPAPRLARRDREP